MNKTELFALLKVRDDNQLLHIFPIKYDSLIPTQIDESPVEGKRYVFRGSAEKVKQMLFRNTSLIRFQAKIGLFHQLNMLIVNQSFYYLKLKSGNQFIFVCYYSEARKVYVVSLVVDADSYFGLSGIRPVYSLPKGVPSYYFTSYIKKIFSSSMPLGISFDLIPNEFLKKYKLLNEYDALRCIHLPKNQQDLYQGLRRFKYEEALIYSLNSLFIKNKIDSEKKKKGQTISHDKINSFVKGLKYKLTKDQVLAIREIVLDMESDKVMYRLLQGDVGTGKTIVAIAALYANFLRGFQGVILAPTFELSVQHFDNVKSILDPFGIRCCLFSGVLTTSKKNKMLEEIEAGNIDVIVSTHAVFSSKVIFKNLGLVVIDEQQRFGVKQREELVEKGNGTDLLMMSATPIPRTLAQIVHSDLDVSTLNQFPHGIRDVVTSVVRSSDPLIYQQIDFYLKQKRQVFVIVPKIESSEKKTADAKSVYEEMCKHYSSDQCQLLHGKIKKNVQDEIYREFLSGKKPILVSTTVVEVGIDVSNAGLLIVFDANYFGLSSLHQLRGRIGRNGEKSTALLIYDGEDENAKKRLDFLASTNDGFKIASYDLQNRGTGSYSGEKQSGRSELQVCDFVNDYPIFMAAKEDAKKMMEQRDNPDYLQMFEFLNKKTDSFLV